MWLLCASWSHPLTITFAYVFREKHPFIDKKPQIAERTTVGEQGPGVRSRKPHNKKFQAHTTDGTRARGRCPVTFPEWSCHAWKNGIQQNTTAFSNTNKYTQKQYNAQQV